MVDLGYGATPGHRGRAARRGWRPRSGRTSRWSAWRSIRSGWPRPQPSADPPRLEFRRGGFELAGLRPVVVRAFNVLRQYDETEVAGAWRTMTALPRRRCWSRAPATSWAGSPPGRTSTAAAPRTLTLSARLSDLDHPADLRRAAAQGADPPQRARASAVHELLRALGRRLGRRRPTPFGPRQRWLATVRRMRDEGWPVLDGRPAGAGAS